MPDYQVLFGARTPNITDKLDTLRDLDPAPRDVTATTLVGAHAAAARATCATSSARLAGDVVDGEGRPARQAHRQAFQRRPARVPVAVSRAGSCSRQPDDLAGLTAPRRGKLDAIEATGKLPPWLGGIRKIESESGDQRGPALVVTLALGGKRIDLADNDFGLGITPCRCPIASRSRWSSCKQGWLVRGNMRFASEADATELDRPRRRSPAARRRQPRDPARARQAARARGRQPRVRATGPRVSYATSISIADARAILAAAASPARPVLRPSAVTAGRDAPRAARFRDRH